MLPTLDETYVVTGTGATPTPIGGGTNWRTVSAGWSYACAARADDIEIAGAKAFRTGELLGA